MDTRKLKRKFFRFMAGKKLDYYNCNAGRVLLVCKEEMREAATECAGINEIKRNGSNSRDRFNIQNSFEY